MVGNSFLHSKDAVSDSMNTKNRKNQTMQSCKQAAVHRDAPQPLYLQLVDEIKKMMAEMSARGEKLLPSERDLLKMFHVSHTTVRLALKELEISKLLLRVPGKGTFIADSGEQSAQDTTPVYGVILENIADGKVADFRLRLLNGIRNAAREKHVSLLLLPEEDEIYMTLAQGGKLSGLIITNPMLSEYKMRELKRLNLPLVTVGRPPMRGIPWVDNDNRAVGKILTEHLLAKGCRKIGFIGLDHSYIVTRDRLAGYKSALKAAGMTARRNLIVFREPGSKVGYHETAMLVDAGADGIVCMDDLLALGALHYLHETHRECPGEIALIGCNNSSFTEYTYPSLTSLDILPEEIGAAAVAQLELLCTHSAIPQNCYIPFRLIPRESTNR